MLSCFQRVYFSGSGASNADVLQDAVKHARIVYKQAAEIGHRLSILDVGGGFQDKSFEKMARSLTESLRAHFPPSVNIIAEPGRFYASSAFSLVTNVIARRNSDKRSAHTMIYQSDGIYGNFMNVIIEKAAMVPELLITDGYDRGSKKYKYSIWGPTCDGVDRINPSCTLKCQIKVGDWLYYHNMGGKLSPHQQQSINTDLYTAYTSSCTTGFNGFDKIHDVIYVCSEPDAADLVAIPLMDQGFLTTKLSLEGLV
jgi:ornithine decarboxylase